MHAPQQPFRLRPQAETAEVTGHVIGRSAREAGAHVLGAEHVDQEIRQLVGAPGQLLRACAPDRVMVKQFRILELDHSRTRAGGRDDQRTLGEGGDRVPGEVAGIFVKAAVEVRLAATRLGLWEIDRDPQPPEQTDRCHAHVGEQGIAEARDQERDLQGIPLSRAPTSNRLYNKRRLSLSSPATTKRTTTSAMRSK